MLNYLRNKRILIGITGGVAAYKILELIRRLKEHGAIVKVILTESGMEFVTPLSIEALGADKLDATPMAHIDLARWCDVMLIAPASANFIAKFSNGLADDLLTTVCLAITAPILVAPAMNQQMWLHPATQQNVTTLKQRNFTILGPANGNQACGEIGPGRMLEASELLEVLEQHFAPKLFSNQHIVITAGPTQEAIDPIRYLSNHSSGKMGYALAMAALNLGATVTLISGPTALTVPNNANLQLRSVITAADMYQAVMDTINNSKFPAKIFIGCAAVADYKPSQAAVHKLKKDQALLNLALERTDDILTAVAKLPSETRPFTIGFAAETENLEHNALQKLQAKNLDLIIANKVGNGLVFNQDQNQVTIYDRNGLVVDLPKMPKLSLAYYILEQSHASLFVEAALDAIS